MPSKYTIPLVQNERVRLAVERRGSLDAVFSGPEASSERVVWIPSEPQTEVAGLQDGVEVLKQMEGH